MSNSEKPPRKINSMDMLQIQYRYSKNTIANAERNSKVQQNLSRDRRQSTIGIKNVPRKTWNRVRSVSVGGINSYSGTYSKDSQNNGKQGNRSRHHSYQDLNKNAINETINEEFESLKNSLSESRGTDLEVFISSWIEQVAESGFNGKMSSGGEMCKPLEWRGLKECSVCKKQYHKPKLLPCLHTFCESCLNKELPQSSLSLTCLICGTQSILPEEGVSALPNNTFMENLLGPKSCVVCKEATVSSQCNECAGYLCRSCERSHKEDSMTDSHTIIPYENGVSENSNDITCSSHAGVQLQFFCTTCDTAICSTCSELSHKDHKFNSLAEVSKGQRDTLDGLIEQSVTKCDEIEGAIDKISTVTSLLSVKQKTGEECINSAFMEMSHMLGERKKQLLEDLQSAHFTKIEVLSEQKNELEKLFENIKSVRSITADAVKKDKDIEILLLTKDLNERLSKLNIDKKELLPRENDYLAFIDVDAKTVRQLLTAYGCIQTNSALAHQSFATGDGLKQCITGKTITVLVTTRDHKGEPVKTGGTDVRGEITSPSGRVRTAAVEDCMNGTYDVMYRTKEEGWHSFSIFVYGQQIKGSPFKVKSYPKPEGSGDRSTPGKHSRTSTPVRKRTSKYASSSQSRGSNRRGNAVEDDLLIRIGVKGRQKGEFTNPQGLSTTISGLILVADSNNQNIQVFENSGEFKLKFGIRGRSTGQMQRPTSVAMTLNGNYVVSDYDNHWVSIYGPDGKYINKLGAGKLLGPKGITVDKNGRIIVIDNKASMVFIYLPSGKLAHKFGSRGNAEHQFAGPHYVACNYNGDIIISDFHNHCIKVFSAEGEFLFSFGSNGEGNGQFNAPTGVAVDDNGNILVADWGNSRIQIFDATGSFLSYINTSGDPLYGPQGLAVTSDGNVVVADSGNHCLKIYKYLQ